MVVPSAHFALPSPAAVTASDGTSIEVWTGRLLRPEEVSVPPLSVLLAHPAVSRATAASAAKALPGRVTVPPWLVSDGADEGVSGAVSSTGPRSGTRVWPAVSVRFSGARVASMVSGADRLLLIDGHSVAYRAFFALPVENFATTTGQHTNAVFGFTSMLINVLRDERPTHVGVAFDVSRQTFRSDEYADYKANRSKSPEEFKGQ